MIYHMNKATSIYNNCIFWATFANTAFEITQICDTNLLAQSENTLLFYIIIITKRSPSNIKQPLANSYLP